MMAGRSLLGLSFLGPVLAASLIAMTPSAATAAPNHNRQGLGISSKSAKRFFGESEPTIRWVSETPTRHGAVTVGVSTSFTCVITLDGPNSDLLEVSLFSRSESDAMILPADISFMERAVKKLSGEKTAQWFGNNVSLAMRGLTSPHPLPLTKEHMSARTTTRLAVAMLAGTIRSVSVLTVAQGVKPLPGAATAPGAGQPPRDGS